MAIDDYDLESYLPGGADGGYSREGFYTRSTDARGHSKSWRYGPGNEVISVPPYLHAALGALRERWPQYRSNGDVFRDVLVHGLKMRMEQADDLPPRAKAAIQFFLAEAEMERLKVRKEAHERVYQAAEQLLSNATTQFELSQAIFAVQDMAMSLDIPDYIARMSRMIERYEGRLS